MITLVCSILLSLKGGDLGTYTTQADVEGKLLGESDYKYLVDFSQGVKRFPIRGEPRDYNEVLVGKTDCVKKLK